nr:unnamed protein product [Callosobruchus analis]
MDWKKKVIRQMIYSQY